MEPQNMLSNIFNRLRERFLFRKNEGNIPILLNILNFTNYLMNTTILLK